MASTDQNGTILIVGAGLSGLALAQILRRHNIAFEIFERDQALHSRKQGWAVSLVECCAPLMQALPDDLGDFMQVSVNYAIREPDALGIVDATSGEQVACLGGQLFGEPGFAIRAGRERTREYLWSNIPVHMGKNLVAIEEDANGVTAKFEDGSSARGAILIGADGASSHVRRALLGAGPVLSSYIPIVGECNLPSHVFEPLHARASAGFIAGKLDLRVLLGLRSIKPDRSSAEYYWALCYRVDDPARESNWAQHASKVELYQKSVALATDLSDELRSIIEHTGPAGMVTPPLKFVEFVSPDVFPQGRVTLIGDAAHAMIPFKAQGANTALLDACDLGSTIVDHSKDGATINWPDLLKDFEKKIIPRGQEKVLGSREAGETWAGITGLVAGRVNTYNH